MIEEAIKYPMNRDDWVKQLIIAGVLVFFFWLIIPAFILGGYFIDVLRQSEAGNEQPPAFDDWGKLLVDGLKGLVIAFVYYLVPTIIFMVVFFILGAGSAGLMGLGGRTGAAAGLAGLGIFILILTLLFFLVALILAYILPAALVNFARTDRMGEAFDFGTIKDAVMTSEYLVGWLLAFVINIVTGVVVQILAFTLVGLLLVPFIYYYAYTVMNNLYGRAFAKGRSA